jgi:predicted transcriptional regulator
MDKRTLTISVDSDWRGGLKNASRKAATTYQGETLNFQRADEFFSMLTGNRWRLLQALLEKVGTTGARELARHLHRDVRRVHDLKSLGFTV